MGCSSSSLPDLDHDQEKLIQKHFHYSSDDIAQLYTAFRKINLTKAKYIELEEFCLRCKCEETAFLNSIFSFFSSQGHTKYPTLTFAEFAFFISFFLTLDEKGMADYLYKILTDNKFHPNMSKKERRSLPVLEETILELFGHAWGSKNKLHHHLAMMDLDHSGTVSEAEFVKNCLKNKSLMFPIVRYQLDLRAKIVSHPFWSQREGLGNTVLPNLLQIRSELHQGSVSGSESPSAPTEVGSSLSSAMAHSVKETEAQAQGQGHGHDHGGHHKQHHKQHHQGGQV
mmetsp:Transcript_30697/g.57192  ORF Transcript_30697/g.57192 Transcript_30697/m.57192 type:complete len:284 (-) Transcript_30697:171-1022(-)